MSKEAKKIIVGSGLDSSTTMGPLVSDEEPQYVNGFITSGVEGGATEVTARVRSNVGAGYFVEPTVLTNAQPSMKIMREEIFGPVVCAESFSYDDLEGIVKKTNETIYGLAPSIWTKDINKAHKVAGMIRSGMVWVNCHNVFDASLPFGGYKQPGWGREMGSEVLSSYTETKAVTVGL